MVKSSCFVLFSRRKLGHKTTFLQNLTYVACSIFTNRDPFNKKQSLYTSIICRYLSYFAEQSAFKRPRLKVFKSSTPTKILLYEFMFLYTRDLKIRVHGKRERKKLPHDHDSPAILQVCRLPFAVFNTKRTDFAFVNNVSIYRKFFNPSTTFTDLCLGLMVF